MSTQTIVIGEQNKVSANKPIEFLSFIEVNSRKDVDVNTDILQPNHWKYIELICKDYAAGLDLMFAYDEPLRREKGTLYLGRWNDGVVE